jgi:DNA-binding NarL/FixJ family response regulator
MRALIEEWLNEAGYCAAGVWQHAPPPFGEPHLVIIDISIPRRAAAEWVKDVQARHPQVPMMAISSQFRAGLSTAGGVAQDLGVGRVLAVPLAREDPLHAVRDMIGPPERG